MPCLIGKRKLFEERPYLFSFPRTSVSENIVCLNVLNFLSYPFEVFYPYHPSQVSKKTSNQQKINIWDRIRTHGFNLLNIRLKNVTSWVSIAFHLMSYLSDFLLISRLSVDKVQNGKYVYFNNQIRRLRNLLRDREHIPISLILYLQSLLPDFHQSFKTKVTRPAYIFFPKAEKHHLQRH